MSNSVKNIGATLDQELKLEKQINLTCRKAWYNLFQIAKLKQYLTNDQLKTSIHAFVISILDNNNSLLIGNPDCAIKKLQSVQNAAAKLVFGRNRYDRSDAPLEQLHWLPVSYRIKFKILLLVYKCLHGKGPLNLSELLCPYVPSRCLRSTSTNILVELRTRTKTFGDRAFCVAGPRLWNSLPSYVKDSKSVEVFKKNLKTHYFKIAFRS